MAERPSIYFHFEFGVSWTPKNRPQAHHLSYASRGMRQRADYPRKQLPPPPNAKYFHPKDSIHPHRHNLHSRPTQRQIEHLRSLYTQNLPPPVSRVEEVSPTASSFAPSWHDRRQSAPSSVADNSWCDEPEPLGATALPAPSGSARMQPSFQKTLSDVPNPFLFGADAMPLSPELYLNHDLPQPPPKNRRRQETDRDRGKAREMASLASALMTVDNGFEDQWWYQGDRIKNLREELVSPTREAPSTSLQPPESAAANDETTEEDTFPPLRRPTVTQDDIFLPRSASSSMVEIVSPLSGSESPASGIRPPLRRSNTIASDELFIYR